MKKRLFSFMLLLVSIACRGLAQNSTDTPDPLKIGDVTVTGSLRTRVYFWDWFERASGNSNYAYLSNFLRVAFSESRATWDWNVEFAVPILLGLPANAVGTGPQQGALGLGSIVVTANNVARITAMIFPKQLFVRLDGPGGDKRHVLQIGRFEFSDGSETTPKNATLAALTKARPPFVLRAHVAT